MTPSRPRFPVLPVGLGMVLAASLLLSSCEKAGSLLKRTKAALDRESAEVEVPKPPLPLEQIPPPPAPVKMEPVVNKEARVSVLGYHDFTEGPSRDDMVLNIGDFRRQMEAIRDAKIPVVSMRQFLDWKQGKGTLPDRCLLITIDDGWKATHGLALGVLKEFGFPFTVFLYKNYIHIGGRSLTHDEIREIAASGGSLGSHSVSHHNLSARQGRSPEAYEAWLRDELVESLRYLEQNYGDTGSVVKAFAYPFGIYNDRVVELAREAGYEACFTVNGKKTTWDTEDMEIGRYVVHGTSLANFDPALDFGGDGVITAGRRLLTAAPSADGAAPSPLVAVKPEANAVITDRLPRIEVDLSKLEGVDPASLVLRVAGFGRVTPDFDPASGRLTYQVPQRLRLETCAVQLTFRHAGSQGNETIAWSFRLDPIADYLSSVPKAPDAPDAPTAPRTAPDPAAPDKGAPASSASRP